MATEAEKQAFLDNVAAPHLAKFYEAAVSRRQFVSQFKQIMGEDGLAPAENRGLPEGETPFPDDDTILTIGGHDVLGKELLMAFRLEEAEDDFVLDSDIAFIGNLLGGSF